MAGPAVPARFAALFGKPRVEDLRALSPAEFREFATFVFTRAGYTVKGRPLGFVTDIDLDLTPAGQGQQAPSVVALRHDKPAQPVSRQLVEKVQRSSAVHKRGASAYVVTSGTCEPLAYEYAARTPQVSVLDGEQFCRYIRYVRSSRFPEGIGLTVVIPPDLFSGALAPVATAVSTKVLVLANNKGGVGKTTTARNLALNMAGRGLHILLVDLDPQGNLTEGLLPRATNAVGRNLASEPSIAHYFAEQSALRDLLRPAAIENEPVNNVALIPAHPDLSLLDTGGAGRPALEVRFAQDLRALGSIPRPAGIQPFEWVIIDTPPAISLFTRAALCSADYVIAPARSRPSSIAGIENMLRTMDTMAELRAQPPQLLGCLLTHWDEDQHSTETYPILETLFDNRRSRLFANYIPFDPTVEKLHGPTQHRARDAYDRVTQEVLEYVERSEYRFHAATAQH